MRPTPVLLLFTVLAAAGCDAVDTSSADTAGTTERAAVMGGDLLARTPTAQRQAAAVDAGFTRGDPDAEIMVVEFSDFGCPYCARFARATFPTIEAEYIETGTMHWRYVPVVFGFPGGGLMGAAALCAADLGGEDLFWRVHDLFYARQQVLRSETARPRLLEWVAELGVDRDALDRCIDDPATTERLRRNSEVARSWFARGTPTFVVNGVPMSGAMPIQFFRRVFDTVLDPSGL